MDFNSVSFLGLNRGFWFVAFPFLIFITWTSIYNYIATKEEREKEKLLNIDDKEFDTLEKIMQKNDKKVLLRYIYKAIKQNEE